MLQLQLPPYLSQDARQVGLGPGWTVAALQKKIPLAEVVVTETIKPRRLSENRAVRLMTAKCLAIAVLLARVTAAVAVGDDAAAQQDSSDRARRRERALAGLEEMYQREMARAILAAGAERNAQAAVNGDPSADEKPRLRAQRFDELMFGRSLPEGVTLMRSRFDSALLQKLDVITWVCGLSKAQHRQLELAGRGDIKRYLDRADDLRRQFSAVEARDGVMIQKVSRGMAVLRDQMSSGLHEEGSLFARILEKALTPEQARRIPAIRAVERAAGTIQRRLRGDGAVNEIRLSARTFTDADLGQLSGLRDLHLLALDGTPITDAGLTHLQGMKNLKILDLARTAIGDAGLFDLRDLTALEELDLSSTRATDAGLAHLGKLTNLRRLYLYGTQITDAGLASLKSLKSLEALHLGQTRITDAGLARLNLKEMKALRELRLEGTPVGDAALAHFDGLKNLQTLDLRMTTVGDAGLPPLAGLANLQYVYLYHTRVTDAGIAALKASLPALKVVP